MPSLAASFAGVQVPAEHRVAQEQGAYHNGRNPEDGHEGDIAHHPPAHEQRHGVQVEDRAAAADGEGQAPGEYHHPQGGREVHDFQLGDDQAVDQAQQGPDGQDGQEDEGGGIDQGELVHVPEVDAPVLEQPQDHPGKGQDGGHRQVDPCRQDHEGHADADETQEGEAAQQVQHVLQAQESRGHQAGDGEQDDQGQVAGKAHEGETPAGLHSLFAPIE
jgi:hypothetical protein